MPKVKFGNAKGRREGREGCSYLGATKDRGKDTRSPPLFASNSFGACIQDFVIGRCIRSSMQPCFSSTLSFADSKLWWLDVTIHYSGSNIAVLSPTYGHRHVQSTGPCSIHDSRPHQPTKVLSPTYCHHHVQSTGPSSIHDSRPYHPGKERPIPWQMELLGT